MSIWRTICACAIRRSKWFVNRNCVIAARSGEIRWWRIVPRRWIWRPTQVRCTYLRRSGTLLHVWSLRIRLYVRHREYAEVNGRLCLYRSTLVESGHDRVGHTVCSSKRTVEQTFERIWMRDQDRPSFLILGCDMLRMHFPSTDSVVGCCLLVSSSSLFVWWIDVLRSKL